MHCPDYVPSSSTAISASPFHFLTIQSMFSPDLASINPFTWIWSRSFTKGLEINFAAQVPNFHRVCMQHNSSLHANAILSTYTFLHPHSHTSRSVLYSTRIHAFHKVADNAGASPTLQFHFSSFRNNPTPSSVKNKRKSTWNRRIGIIRPPFGVRHRGKGNCNLQLFESVRAHETPVIVEWLMRCGIVHCF